MHNNNIKIIVSKKLKKMFPFYEPFDFNFTYQNIENKNEKEKQRLRETIAYYCEQNARINQAYEYAKKRIRINFDYYYEMKKLECLFFRNQKIILTIDEQLKKICNFNHE